MINKICQKTIYRSKINLFCDYNHIISETIPISVVVCPQLLLKQRFCKPDFNCLQRIKIILTLFNYEYRTYEKLLLSHSLEGIPFTYLDVSSKDEFSIDKGILNIKIDCMPPLSVKSFIIDVFSNGTGKFISKLVLKECINCNPEIIRVCECQQII